MRGVLFRQGFGGHSGKADVPAIALAAAGFRNEADGVFRHALVLGNVLAGGMGCSGASGTRHNRARIAETVSAYSRFLRSAYTAIAAAIPHQAAEQSAQEDGCKR